MSLEACESAYLALSKRIFTPRRRRGNFMGQKLDFLKADGKFDSEILEDEIKKQIKLMISENESAEEILLKEENAACKV
jgi:hypothetical protein